MGRVCQSKSVCFDIVTYKFFESPSLLKYSKSYHLKVFQLKLLQNIGQKSKCYTLEKVRTEVCQYLNCQIKI